MGVDNDREVPNALGPGVEVMGDGRKRGEEEREGEKARACISFFLIDFATF